MRNESNIESPSDIFDCWHSGTEACNDCPRRDDDLRAKPYFGFGELPADVIVLGEAPGGYKTGENNMMKTDKRIWKNFREVKGIAGNTDERGTDSFLFEPIEEMNNFEYVCPFFEKINARFTEVFGRDCRFYYTNYTKCNDIHDDVPEAQWFSDLPDSAPELNEAGTEQCRNFFSREFELANPSAVLIFSKGTSHLSRVLSDHGHSISVDSVTDAVLDKNFAPDESPIRVYEPEGLSIPIIPSYHFKQGFGELSKQINRGWINEVDLGDRDEDYNGIKRRYADELAIELVYQVQEANSFCQ